MEETLASFLGVISRRGSRGGLPYFHSLYDFYDFNDFNGFNGINDGSPAFWLMNS